MDYSTLQPNIPQDEDGFIFDVGSLYAHLSHVPDQRKRRGVRYALVVILVALVLAKLAGQDKPKGMAEWVRLRKALFIDLFQLPRPTMPHAVTYERVLTKGVNVTDLEAKVSQFLAHLPEAGRSVQLTVDGKTLRGTLSGDPPQGVHLLAVYLPDTGLVLCQLTVDPTTNEITVLPQALKRLNLQGKIITGDALHTQREPSRTIVERGGEYVWIAKDNQASLRQDIEQLFQPETCLPGTSPVINDLRTAQTHEKNRGRIETRALTASSLLAEGSDWPGLAQVFKLERVTRFLKTGQVRTQVVYGLTSLTAEEADPERLLALARTHWGIENGLHYRRDVTFGEDRLRSRSPTFAQAIACLNNLVIGLASHLGWTNLAQARRHFDAHPDLALRLLFSRPA